MKNRDGVGDPKPGWEGFGVPANDAPEFRGDWGLGRGVKVSSTVEFSVSSSEVLRLSRLLQGRHPPSDPFNPGLLDDSSSSVLICTG